MADQQVLVSATNHVLHDQTEDRSECANSLRSELTTFLKYLGVFLLKLYLKTHPHVACGENDWHNGEESH